MALENQKAVFEVSVQHTGHGAAEAAKEMNTLRAAAQSTTTASVGTSNAMTGLRQSSAALKDSMRALETTALLLGSSRFPQLTTAVLATRSAMTLTRTAAVATGTSLGLMVPVLVGIAGAAASAATGLQALQAKREETQSNVDLAVGAYQKEIAMLHLLNKTENEGKITNAEKLKFVDFLSAAKSEVELLAALKTVGQKIRGLVGTQEEIDGLREFGNLQRKLFIEGTEGYEREQQAAAQLYAEQLNIIALAAKKAGRKVSGEDVAVLQDIALAARELKERNALYKQLDQEVAESKAALQEKLSELEQQITLDVLQGNQTQEQGAQQLHDKKVALLQDFAAQNRITNQDVVQGERDAQIEILRASQKTQQQQVKTLTENQQLAAQAQELFASGFADAFVAFASGTKSAEEAFKQFAASFLQDLSRMIIKMLVLRALRSVFGGGAAEGGMFAQRGGMFPSYAANGIQSVSRPTYFPRFNVVAGEAGREMLTVLAKPRMMEVGGVESVVGFAGSKRLAISSADQLAARGGGVAEIRISMEPGLRAQITNDSINGAVVRVTNDMGQDSLLRRKTQRAAK